MKAAEEHTQQKDTLFLEKNIIRYADIQILHLIINKVYYFGSGEHDSLYLMHAQSAYDI